MSLDALNGASAPAGGALGAGMPLFDMVQIETSTYCNFQCAFCPHGKIPLRHGTMADELFDCIVKQLRELHFAGTIFPYLNNEPLMDPALPKRVAMLHEACPEARIWIDTNGSLATVELLTTLVEAGASVINIELYLARGKRIPSKYLALHAELPERARRRVFLYEREANAVLTNRAGNLPGRPVPASPLRLPCEYPFRQIYIGFDGELLLCCQDWSREMVMGNLRDESLVEIWQGERYEARRRLLLQSSRAARLCERCDYSGRPADMPAKFRSALPFGDRARWRLAHMASLWRDVIGNHMLARYARSWYRRRVRGVTRIKQVEGR